MNQALKEDCEYYMNTVQARAVCIECYYATSRFLYIYLHLKSLGVLVSSSTWTARTYTRILFVDFSFAFNTIISALQQDNLS